MAKTGGTIFVPQEPEDEQRIEIADGVSHRFVSVMVDDEEVVIENERGDRVWRSNETDVIDFVKAIAEHVRGTELTP